MEVVVIYIVTPRRADSPLGSGGWSARVMPRYLAGCGPVRHLLIPPSFHRSEMSGALPLAPSSPPSVDLPPPATKPRFLAREPSRHLLHLPKPPVQLLPGRNRPTTAGHHWRHLKLCSIVDPLLRSSSTRTDRGNGFMVSHLCPWPLFPSRCALPAPVKHRRRRRRAYCRLSGGLQK